MVIRVNKRNELKNYLEKEGIMTSIHYPLHYQKHLHLKNNTIVIAKG